RNIPVRQIIPQPAANLRPFRVEGSNGQKIGNVDLVDEVVGLRNQILDHVQACNVDGGVALQRDGRSHSSDQIIGMRIFSAEDRVDLHQFLLPLQRLQVVRNGQEVGLRWQLVGRMSPVSVGENAELAGVDVFFQ